MVGGEGERLPGAGVDDADEDDRIVCHVDMDCFYASCERLREPDLHGEPVVVGMGYESGEPHGAVATASYEARAYGVESAQPISQALDRLPRKDVARDDPDLDPADAAHYRPVDLEYYREIASAIKDILHECADRVREVSVDEAYLDVTERTGWTVVNGRPLAEGYARHIKDRIAREVGVPASVGVAPTMSAAKVASDHDKPDGLVVVEPGDVRDFFDPLPVEAVHGVGPVTARKLGEMGIETAGDLAAAESGAIRERFGERGRTLYDRARGHDDREVRPTGRPKSLSRESAFTEATADPERQRETVDGLAADVAERAEGKDALYRTIGIKAVTPPYDVNTRERSLPGPVADADLVREVALDLLAEFEGDPIRKLGVRVSNLQFEAAAQARLDGWGSSETGTATDDDTSRPSSSDGQSSLTDF
ncbi:DNA polymerase IV [Haloplanus aerogenes]|uniref:DNA polymerase IV n=1 Tax=Haloplanus aerogenes TaxID=660522 RepID=A0A3G8QTD6_9EURY|nr:DNA polymerase IV [Haloplanus aerogenes]AZH25021.1 DNA polymerase IV [Haloplanus aerogenes]RMB13761.1 DNA polymerase IV (DinB-like DNA polymerase) [Haloplanus aerogenes]